MSDYADIQIDGKNYRINLPTYQSKDIIDFAPRASVPNGSVFMSDLSLYQPLVQTDWRHGFGFHWYMDGSGYLRTVGNIDTRQDGLVMMYTNGVSSDTDNDIRRGVSVFNNSLYSRGVSGVRKLTAGVWSDEYTTLEVFDLLPTSSYLFYTPITARIRKINTSGVHSDAGANANAANFTWMIIHNGYIYAGERNSNRIHYDNSEDLSTLEGGAGDAGAIPCGIGNFPTLGAVVYAGQLYVSRADGLWIIGEDNIARNVIDYSSEISSNNFRSMVVINGLLVFPIRDRIVQWNGARVSDITPQRLTDEFPYMTYGQFSNFVAVDNFLYCTARTNESVYDEDLIAWDGVGWHRLTSLVTDSSTQSVTMLKYESLYNRLWYHVYNSTGPTNTTSYIQHQDRSSFPYANFPTTGQHSLISSRMDMGFRQVKKSMQALSVEARNVSAARYIRVYYSLDGGDWILWSDIIENGITELTNPGGFRTIEFNYALLRFDFVTDSAAQSPVMESFTMRFIMRPDVRWGYSFDVIAASSVESEGTQDERTASEIKEDLREIRDSKEPVSFVGLLGETIYGYLTSVKEQPVYRTLESDNGSYYIEYLISCSFVEMI